MEQPELQARPSAHRSVLVLAVPLILSNLSVPLVGAVDTAVMGQLDAPHFMGGVAVGGILFSFLFWGFSFLRMGTTGLTATALGQDNRTEVVATLIRGLILAAIFGALVILLSKPIGLFALPLMGGSEDVQATANSYYAIRVWSAPFVLANYCLIGWLLGNQNATATLLMTLWTNLVNIALDIALVIGLEWGVAGVAVATLVAESSATLVGAFLVRRQLQRLARQPGTEGRTSLTRRSLFEPAKLRSLVSVNRDIFIRTLCLITGFAFFTAQSARQTEVILAANAILLQFQSIMAYGLDGFAHAVEAIAGRLAGARDAEGLRSVVRAGLHWSLGAAVIIGGAFALGGTALINLFTGLQDVREAAATYLIWMIVSPVISVGAYLLDGLFIGTLRTRDMRNAAILSLVIYLGSFSILWPLLGNHGLWLALMILMGARGLTLAARYPSLERSVRRQ